MTHPFGDDELMTPAEAAEATGVSTSQLHRMAISGRLSAVRTPGGHNRYRRSEVTKLARDLGYRR